MTPLKQLFRGAGWCALLFICGCAKTPPPVTEAEGIVLLDGRPLAQAQVEFVPELAHFGAEMNSTAVTDDQGRFHLQCNHKGQAGAAVAKHWVTVKEAAMPEELRGQSAEAQQKQAAFLAKLTNRPIPPVYGSVSTTPLKVEVTKGQKTYELKLVRKG